ncbi:MAG: outer membrane lipoprotein-sorting protein [Candidatus Marinimicrobia bacterium]|nr:outer membrane lipoprotein-sorting protein [Candidatus Neomarinimicrobiota bacterium]
MVFAQLGLAQISGRDIMQKVDEQASVRTEMNKSKMTLINDKGKTRERELTRYIKSFDGAGGIDTKTLIIFDYPADIRGTGLLLWTYTDAAKDDDRWLYLPALKKVRRIAGESKNDYFMGTDFTYDDMGARNIDDDNHTLLGKETIDGIECYKVESVPVNKNDLYSKKITWIIPEKWVFMKVEFYDKSGVLQKVLTTSDIREIDGIWLPHVLFMNNFSKTHQTKIEVHEVKFDSKMDDQIFTQTILQRGRVQ